MPAPRQHEAHGVRWAALTAIVVAALAGGIGPGVAEAQSRAELVRLPVPKYDGTLTPYTFEIGYPLVTLVYDTLLWRDAEGVPRPWLARSVTRSNGGRRLTIRLREGVRWHDGRALSADDVAFTFQFVADRPHPRFTAQLADVEQVQATDRLTVTIDLRRPSLGFDDQPLADLPILPRHLWQGLAADRDAPAGLPVGSGPYRLMEAEPDEGYAFGANRAYFKGRPRVERLEVPIINQDQRAYRALRRRKIDMLPMSLPEDPAEGLGDSLDITVRRGASYAGTALLLNLRRPPFDRAAVRTAVARALDLELMVRNAGPGVAADRGYIHPASRWSSDVVLQRYDLPAARRAFARLELPPIRVLAPDNDPVRLEAGRQVMLAVRRAGGEATLTEVSNPELSQAIADNGSAPDFEAAIVTTPALASYDPDFLARLFGSDPRTSPLNNSGYRSAAFADLADRVATAPDREARRRAVAAQLRLLARDLPEIPLFFSEGAFAYRPAIHDGWVFIKGTGILDKRSFLAGGPSEPAAQDRGGEGEEPAEDSGAVLNVLSVGSLVVLGVVLVAVAVALVRQRVGTRRY
jgi:peptide/nickel transport system substrate-binding protein